MKYIKYIAVGMLFGFILTKAELISWFRWQEMFRFESFHIYGVMLSAVATGALGLWLIKKLGIKDIAGRPIVIPDKQFSIPRYAIGGLIFGLGWSIAGCPGAHYALIGHGNASVIFILLSAILGTWVYGWKGHRLPH